MCVVDPNRNRKILPYLATILGWCDPDDWTMAPDDWDDLDIVYRETRVPAPCMICGAWSNFCRVVEMCDNKNYWADLCSEHTDPDNLTGLRWVRGETHALWGAP